MTHTNDMVPAEGNILSPAVSEIRKLLEKSRRRVASQVNQELLTTYWQIGEIIVRYEQNEKVRAAYGESTLRQLSKELTRELGKGFSVSNIQFMRRFYLTYEKQQTLSVKLSWSHYCELLSISDPDKRSFYEKECIQSGWSVQPDFRFQICAVYAEERAAARAGGTRTGAVARAGGAS